MRVSSARNAVHGVSYGLEYPLYFAPGDAAAQEIPTLRRSSAFAPVAAECRAARSTGGVLDASSFSRFEFCGPGAEAYLDRLLAAKLPEVGRVRLTPMLAASGRLMGDLTTAAARHRTASSSSGPATCRPGIERWFQRTPAEAGVTLRNLSRGLGRYRDVMGPRSRELLARTDPRT